MAKKEIRSYRDLIVWQRAHNSVKKIFCIIRKFPKSDEAMIIKRQIIRSSTSVAANIAEGFGGAKVVYFKILSR